jgi:sec-independent protein translocase protein TatA
MTLLFLNSLGTGEVVLIMFVVLILFGSKGIPDFAKNLGKGMREIRNASNEIKRDIQQSALDMRKDLKVEEPFEDISKLKDIGNDIMKEEKPTSDQDSKEKSA